MKTELSKEERGCCLKAIGIAATALVVLTVVVGWLWSRHAQEVRESLQEVEARWSASGAPVTIDDLIDRTPPGDPKTFEWLQGFEEEVVAWRAEDLWTLPGARRAAETARQSGADPVDLARLESWVTCLEDAPRDSVLFEREFWEAYRWSVDPMELSDCEYFAVCLSLESSGPRYERALGVYERGPIDMRDRIRASTEQGGDFTEQTFPKLPVGSYLTVVRILTDSSVLAALEGDPGEALSLLHQSLHAVDLLGEPATLMGLLARDLGFNIALAGLEHTLPRLPAEADLSRVRKFLSDPDPKRDLVLALEAERVHGNRVFDLIETGSRDGGAGRGNRPRDWLSRWSSAPLEADRTDYLRAMESHIGECSSPWSRSSTTAAAPRPDRSRSRTAAMLLPQLDNLRAAAAEKEVRLLLALTALEARTGGVEAAMAAITARTDPFSGSPFHARIEENGTLVMWSVGSDGIDQDAGLDEDIVWRFWVLR